MEYFRGLLYCLVDFCLAGFGKLQAKRNIFSHSHMRIQRVTLKYHGNTALRWRHIIYQTPADVQTSRGYTLEPCDNAQQSGLSAT